MDASRTVRAVKNRHRFMCHRPTQLYARSGKGDAGDASQGLIGEVPTVS